MIIYSVTVSLQAEIEAEWVDWMSRVHVPDVLRTGCFTQCRMHKVLGLPADEPMYVMQYDCSSTEEYHRYRDEFAPALQKDHSDRYGSKVRGSRQLLQHVLTVPRPS
jgi:hypothetical protein